MTVLKVVVGVAEATDAELVEAARGGDLDAAEALMARYLPLVYNVVGRALAGHADTDDVVQETMLRAIGGLAGLREPEQFRAWLITVAIRQVKDRARARRRAGDGQVFDVPDVGVDVEGDAVDRADEAEERRRFLDAVGRVSPEDRAVLALWWQELNGDLTRAEVAEALGVTPTHAGVRIQRMRSRLALAHMTLTAYAARPRCPGLTAVTRGSLPGSHAATRGPLPAQRTTTRDALPGEHATARDPLPAQHATARDPLPGRQDLRAGERVFGRMVRHVRGCPVCQAAGRGLLPPESQVRGIGALLLPASVLPATALLAKHVGAGHVVASGVLHRIVEALSIKRAALVAASTAGAVAGVVMVLLPSTRPEEPQAQPPPRARPPVVVAPRVPAPVASTSPSAVTKPVAARRIYVAKAGDDRAAGTESAPLATVNRAVELARVGDTILLRDGFHRVTAPLEITTDGTAERPITLTNYPGERPSIDAGQVASDGAFITHRADHWIVSGLDVWGAEGPAYECISCSGNVFRNLSVHGNAGSAFTVSGAGASGNRIVNSDFYDNAEPAGSAADGLTFAAGSGAGNVVLGCRTYDNVDDGVAVEGFTSGVTIDSSWSWGNGINRWGLARVSGTGHGFDLGSGKAVHTVLRSAAWKNNGDGFTGGGAAHRLTRDSAFRNAGDGFAFTSAVLLQDSLAQGNEQDINVPPEAIATANARQLPAETDPATAEATRPADGSLPPTGYLKSGEVGAPMTPAKD
ncbi:sigma-70 family RNA polymerase sigma factor [Actinoplanes sp. LDG1-06]|uniref:RNA polymerase sigma factor n=1 Tax=Paractinoplanes ovalisporus TaxID=2810368 RepID=A0ABS2AKC6_9ACTN|nr:sigma-70 family RNA polymerase sigma factor [Actinoplanes ovalisporus]MBM2620307.1 sigma-70 family RNA polymerase sigma factor [Actinoplanes ovalisporus]